MLCSIILCHFAKGAQITFCAVAKGTVIGNPLDHFACDNRELHFVIPQGELKFK
jgi:hypothetical protein